MTPSIKLTYFDLRGRAEMIRLAFVIGDVPFEDDRVSRESWPELKPKTPFGQLPVMEVDGKTYPQSGAHLRFAGKLSGLYPEDAIAALAVDEICDDFHDLFASVYRYRGPDKEKLREERIKFVEVDVPRMLPVMEKRLQDLGKGPWAVGDSVSIADTVIANFVTTIKCGILDHVPKDVLDGYERTMASYNAFMNLPKVVEWYKKHPIKYV